MKAFLWILKDGDNTNTGTTTGTSMQDSDGDPKRSYIRLNVGNQNLLIQWGQVSVSYSTSGSTTQINFPKQYNNSHYPVVICTPKTSSITRWYVSGHNSSSVTIGAYGNSSGTGRMFWLAICCG